MTHVHTGKRQEQDEWVCSDCGCRWGVDEDAPPCGREPTIIGFSGDAGSGKTTAAHHLRDNHGFHHMKFADTLKDMIRNLLYDMGVDEEQAEEMIEGQLKEEPFDFIGGKSTRQLMQSIGTDWARDHVDEDLWVTVMSCRIKALRKEDPYVDIVIDDVRFENEASLIRSIGGGVIRIAGRSGTVTKHRSEEGNPLHDATYTNSGTISDLKSFLDRICDET